MPQIHDGIVKVQTAQSVQRAMDRLQGLVEAQGLLVFARIDFSRDAALAGQIMRPTELLIFGSPKAGTPLMVDTPSVALDLPLKVLVAQDETGLTWYSYNDPAYLQARHGFCETMIKNIAGIKSFVEQAAA